ncbi:MAG: hypothetical protein JO240_07515, partial [Solirubrobacterales bacterium]|nr:hypothetical protein [Solirubrobacterales bacterium]
MASSPDSEVQRGPRPLGDARSGLAVVRSPGSVVSLVRARIAHPLAQGGLFLAINSALIGLLGVVYWIEAAHLFGAATVGRNSALIAAMNVLSGLAQLNFARALSGLVPRAGRRSPQVVLRT